MIAKNKSNINLLILGEGNQHSCLEDLTERLNLKGRVFMPGVVNNPYPYIAQANVLVLSSKYEGFGIVIIEAMACKVPVVATRCPEGPAEIIEDGKTGLLVPPGDKDALAKAINKLLDNRILCKSLTESAYEKVKEKFTLEKMIKQYEELLDGKRF